MKRKYPARLFLLGMFLCFSFSACTASIRNPDAPTPSTGTPMQSESTPVKNSTVGSGIERITANAAIRPIGSGLDSILIEYGDEIVLPDENPEALYSITDAEAENRQCAVKAVYTNNQLQIREDETSVPGCYVIVQFAPVETSGNTRAVGGMAGSAVLWQQSSSASVIRMDYSGLVIRQKFGAVNKSGQVVQPVGQLPELQYKDISWPQLKGFSIDKVLVGKQGDIHYSYYLPDGYNPSKRYPMAVTLPGYNRLLLSNDEDARGVNVYADYSATAWAEADEDVIVLAPQLTGWDEKSALQTIELTEYFLKNYSIDPDRVYATGYSAGGETMSRVMNTRAGLFAAYLHCSSQWDGSYDSVVKNRMPVYIFMAQNDEYYGSQRAIDAYEALHARYIEEGLSEKEIEQLVVLNTPGNSYFNQQGIYNYHAGGQLAISNQAIMRWMLEKRKK